jgi:uncharacterized protein YkwD
MTINLRRRMAGLGVAAVVLTAGSFWIGHQAEPRSDESVAAAEPIASFNDLLAWLRRPTTTTTARPTTTTVRPTTTTKPPTTTTVAPTTTKPPVTTTTVRPTTTTVRPTTTTVAPTTTAAPATTVPASGGAATATQLDLLAQVNARRATGVSCGGTWFPAVPALSLQGNLGTAAQNYAVDMATYNYFSHTGRDGSSPGDRITAAGYRWQAWAENIAAGQQTTTAVVTAWFNSTGHCENFMSSSVTQIGFGLAQNPSSSYRIYWVADMGRPR